MNGSTAARRRLAVLAKAEQLLRDGEYTVQALHPLLGVSHTSGKVLMAGLIGGERDRAKVFVSSWEVSRGIRRIRVRPRYRWRLGAEADAPKPAAVAVDLEVDLGARKRAAVSRPVPMFASDPLMGCLFGSRA